MGSGICQVGDARCHDFFFVCFVCFVCFFAVAIVDKHVDTGIVAQMDKILKRLFLLRRRVLSGGRRDERPEAHKHRQTKMGVIGGAFVFVFLFVFCLLIVVVIVSLFFAHGT